MDRKEQLVKLLPLPEEELENKWFKDFERQARYVGNGVYSWHSIYSSDTRELWLLGVLAREGIVVPKEENYE